MRGHSPRYQLVAAVALVLPASAGWSSSAPVVEAKPATVVTNVSRELLDNLPSGRRVEDLVRTCPSETMPTITRQPGMLVDGVPSQPTIGLDCVRPDDLDMVEVLKVHNAARAEYGAAPLAWDPVLIQGPYGAQTYVNQLARTGVQVHSSREGRGTIRENLSQGLPTWSVSQLVGSWTKEKAKFKPGVFPDVSTTGNWYDVGHWAQMIWIQTVVVGCAKAAGIGGTWLVCRYDPGGNKDGKTVGIPPLKVAEVQQPTLPNAEVFKPTAQPAKAKTDEGMTVRTAPLFDLGIMSGGAWTTDWFAIGDGEMAGEPIGENDYGFGGAVYAGPTLELPRNFYGYDGTILTPRDVTSEAQCRVSKSATPKQSDYQETPSEKAWLDFLHAKHAYDGAELHHDTAKMAEAKVEMNRAIAVQRALPESGDFLDKMVTRYEDTTGELPNGPISEPTATPSTELVTGHGGADLDSVLADAESRLNAAAGGSGTIDLAHFNWVFEEAEFQWQSRADSAGGKPVDMTKLDSQLRKAMAIYRQAQDISKARAAASANDATPAAAENDSPTGVGQPTLPTKEVFDPNANKNCPLDVM